MINRARPMSDFTDRVIVPDPEIQPQKRSGTLYLRLPGEQHPAYRKVKAIINMFPGDSKAVVYFTDTKLRRGALCDLDSRMLNELENLLGKENVVVK